MRAAAAFRRSRRAMESAETTRLATERPLRQRHLPLRLVAGLTASDIDLMAGVLAESEADRG